MNEKGNNNVFCFSLYQEKILLGEKIFDADQFNPFTRYSIDIRDILPQIISKLQKTLSKKSYEIITSVIDETQYNPQPIIQKIEEKVIKGVECKIGLYINDNPIVERLFYVDGFNPLARWSTDLTNDIVEISDNILNHIKKTDVKNMWDDYDLINRKGLTINQIRELSPAKREEMLKRI
jgi:hypothetical protein